MRYVIVFFAIFIFAAAAHAERVEFSSYPGLQNKISNEFRRPPCFVVLGSFTDSLMGNVWWTGSSLTSDLGRKNDHKYPGFYLNPPNVPGQADLGKNEKDILKNKLNELFAFRLDSNQLLNDIFTYNNVFGDSSRDEFFGTENIDGTQISLGGWIDKFISIAVYTEFDDIDSFIEKAGVYYKLASLDKEQVSAHKRGTEFLYSFKNEENMFVLRGYKVFPSCGEKSISKVIELIKYYDEEFMP